MGPVVGDGSKQIRGAAGASPTRRDLLAIAAAGAVAGSGVPRLAFAAAPAGQLTYAVHVSLAPNWFDPAETQGIITPFMVLYALHDAMVKPMPGNPQAPCLAESWTEAPDAKSYEFVIRKGPSSITAIRSPRKMSSSRSSSGSVTI